MATSKTSGLLSSPTVPWLDIGARPCRLVEERPCRGSEGKLLLPCERARLGVLPGQVRDLGMPIKKTFFQSKKLFYNQTKKLSLCNRREEGSTEEKKAGRKEGRQEERKEGEEREGGRKEGRQEGRKEGRKQGRKEGRQAGRQTGRKKEVGQQGRQERRNKGRKEGRHEGRQTGKMEGRLR